MRRCSQSPTLCICLCLFDCLRDKRAKTERKFFNQDRVSDDSMFWFLSHTHNNQTSSVSNSQALYLFASSISLPLFHLSCFPVCPFSWSPNEACFGADI